MMRAMIGHLAGTIKTTRDTHLILDVNGVGYKVFTLKETIARASMKEGTWSFWTHVAVREDALDVFGFVREEELRFFELLLTVPGIGPKSALAETLRSAIASGNAGYLTNVSGIGKKTAEKIVLELKDKVRGGEFAATGALKGDEEALEAMRSLGYSAAEARDVLRKVPPEIESGSARLREALKLLGR
jgi:holliday junction DNA helicase RuvA